MLARSTACRHGEAGLDEGHVDQQHAAVTDQQVLRSGVSSTNPCGVGWAGRRLHQRQRVVLLLDQPADGVERLLVLQAAVQQLPAELVPAVLACGCGRTACRTAARWVALDG